MSTNFKKAAEFLAAAENICDELYPNGSTYKTGVTVLKTGRRTIKNQRNYKIRKQIHWSLAHTRKYANRAHEQEEFFKIVENDPLRAKEIIAENMDKAEGILVNMSLLRQYMSETIVRNKKG
tara:strand:- start:67 stop:432 length:366 start_codon:yes stop_codon:yes gene_type:complete